jgi:transposase
MSEAMARQREEWRSLVDQINMRIKSLDAWLEQQAKRDGRVLRLQTHPGIGLLTSLALVHSLEPVSRFAGERKVAAYVGLTPAQHSSGDVVRMGRITRSGKNSLRGTLVEAAWRMVSKDSAMRKQYEQIKARAGAKRAIVAVARRLLLRAGRMLLDGRAYVAEPVAA